MYQRIVAPKAARKPDMPVIPPTRIRSVVVEVDGRRQAFMTVRDAYIFLARTYVEEIRYLRSLEEPEEREEAAS